MEPFLIIGGVILVLIAIIFLSVHLERKRTEKVKAMAEQLGFRFHIADEGGLLRHMEGFYLFRRGRARRIDNLMEGEVDGLPVRLFDYRFTTGRGKSRKTWVQTVLYIRSESLNLPVFSLNPENIFHKIGGAFGYQDIDFEESPDFSRWYLLRGKDEEAVRRAFRQSVRLFYEERRGLCTEGQGERLIIYRSAKRVKPEDMELFIRDGIELYKRLKS